MSIDKPRYRVPALSRAPAGLRADAADPFTPWNPAGSGASFEAGGFGRRLKNFLPSRQHVNRAIEVSGRTLIKRARFLVENNGYAGNAVDVWAAWAAGDGIRPTLKLASKTRKRKIQSLFTRWVEEADAEGMTDFYGLQEKIVREAYITGECFVRFLSRRPRTMRTVPVQLQVLPSEMLDTSFHRTLDGGSFIRMGVEFDSAGRRAAYWFWRYHPDDLVMHMPVADLRVRVPASEVMHIIDARQAGQIRGVPKFARAMVKIFSLDLYDDAELERKKTAALYGGFITKTGESSPVDDEVDESDGFVPLEPGAMVELNPGEGVEFSAPADVGGSYEPFQYRTLLQVCAALGIPYAYLTGDCTKGNFSNVRTEIINFRRRVKQWQNNVLIHQFCRAVWTRWLDTAFTAGLLPEMGGDPAKNGHDEDWLPPSSEWIDPLKDVQAEIRAVRAGFKTRSSVVAERGNDREALDEELKQEAEEADRLGLILDSDARRVSANGGTNAVPSGSGFLGPDDEPAEPVDMPDDPAATEDE